MSDIAVTLHLTSDEALVLFDLLARYEETEQITLEHQGEIVALWRLQAALAKALVEPFQLDYPKLLASARKRLAEEAGLAPK